MLVRGVERVDSPPAWRSRVHLSIPRPNPPTEMTQVVVRPDDLRATASALEAASHELETAVRRLTVETTGTRFNPADPHFSLSHHAARLTTATHRLTSAARASRHDCSVMAHTSEQAEAGDAPWSSWSVWGSLFGPPAPNRYSASACEPPAPSVPPVGSSPEDDEDEGRSFFAALDSAAEHFFGTDIFDGDRWSRFLGDLGSGAKEISSLQPMSPEHIRMMATDPREMLSRYQSVGIGLWDFTKGTGTFAYDASSLIPGSVAFVTEMHRTTAGGEHRGVRLVEQLSTAALPLASLAPGTPMFYSELGEAVRNRSIADHDGIQAAATMTVAVVNWETFTEDPSRWFGTMLGEIGLEIATAGTLSGAIGAAGASDKPSPGRR